MQDLFLIFFTHFANISTRLRILHVLFVCKISSRLNKFYEPNRQTDNHDGHISLDSGLFINGLSHN